MLFGTDTKVAIDVSGSLDAASTPSLTVGYTRREFVFMPLFINAQDSSLVPDEVPGLAFNAGTRLRSQGRSTIRFPTPTVRLAIPANRPISLPSEAEFLADAGTIVVLPNEGTTRLEGASAFLLPAGTQITSPIALNISTAPAALNENTEILLSAPYIANVQEARYVGTRRGVDGSGNQFLEEDTYSVLASFGAEFGAAGRGDQVEASGGIVQFFATGRAAIQLAERGGEKLVVLPTGSQQALEQAEARAENAEEMNRTFAGLTQAQLAAAERRGAEIRLEEDQIRSLITNAIKLNENDTFDEGEKSRRNEIVSLIPEEDRSEDIKEFASTESLENLTLSIDDLEEGLETVYNATLNFLSK